MILSLLGLALGASSGPEACPAQGLSAPGSSLQVVWISPVRQRVGANQAIQVVRVDQLQSWVHSNAADQTRVLQALGLVGKRGGWRSRRLYKATVFEVDSEQLCRPLQGWPAGEVVSEVRACDRSRSCGWTQDSLTGQDALEAFEIDWREAARWGFCVAPAELYLQEL